MSIKVTSYYWEKAPHLSGDELLILLALADWCNDDGYCFYGMEKIRARIRRDHRNAQRSIKRLEDKGELLVCPGDGIAANGGVTNRYYLLGYCAANDISIPTEVMEAAQSKRKKQRVIGETGYGRSHFGVAPTPLGGVAPTPLGGVAPTPLGGVASTPLKPSVDPSDHPSDHPWGGEIYTDRIATPSQLTDSAPRTAQAPNMAEVNFYKTANTSLTDTVQSQPTTQPNVTGAILPPPVANTPPQAAAHRIVADDPPVTTPERRLAALMEPLNRSKPIEADPRLTVDGLWPTGTGMTAYEVYREFTPYIPSKLQIQAMNVACTDLVRWRSTLHDCLVMRSFRCNNFADLFDVYRNGLRERRVLQDGRKATTRATTAPTTTAEPTADTYGHEQPSPEVMAAYREIERQIAAGEYKY